MEAGIRDQEDRLVGRAHHPTPQSSQPQSHSAHQDDNDDTSPRARELPYPDDRHEHSAARSKHLYYGIDTSSSTKFNHSHGAEAVPLRLQHPRSGALASNAANNVHAANANANLNGIANPDDFYTSYRAADLSTPDHIFSGEHDGLMASSSTLTPAQRQNPNASLRSNSNGSTPRHPAVTTATPKAGTRPASRSVSAPLAEGSVGGATKLRPAAYNSRQPSVKDLKKRFDQNAAAQVSNGSTSMPSARGPAPRSVPRESPSASASYRGVGNVNGSTPPPTLRSHSTAGNTPSARPSQRPRYHPEDQVSSNSQSFASRIAKPRANSSLSSKSMSNLSPASPTATHTIPPPAPARESSHAKVPSQSLLFGEILPGDHDIGTAGYGIDGVRQRRTSDSNIQAPPMLHQRSLSHADAEPASPTDWYRHPEPKRDRSASPAKLYKSHDRSHSDLAGTKAALAQLKTPLTSRKQQAASSSDRSIAGTSKLPVSIRKNSPSSEESPPVSRSHTPSAGRRPASRAQGKIPKPSPINTSSTRAKTPTSSQAAKPRPGAITPNGNTRLNAYISAPPPKLSPPLRSSRPRQPVSSATTASSRMRAVDRGRSPARPDSRTNKHSEPQRRRKLSMGPIDFKARREQIKLSYTKSIKETEAKAAAKRQAAIEEEKRRRAEEERMAAEEAHRIELERQREEQAREDEQKAALEAEQSHPEPAKRDQHREKPATVVSRVPEPPLPPDFLAPILEPPLPPDFLVPGTPSSATKISLDSPTLGMPGTFPSVGSPSRHEEAPPSATSDTTEFDTEAQTEPPYQAPESTVTGYDGSDEVSSIARTVSQYKSPFEESPQDDTASINISLDLTPSQHEEVAASSNDAAMDRSSAPPSRDEYAQPSISPAHQTTVTIVSRDSGYMAYSPGAEGSPPESAEHAEDTYQDMSDERSRHVQASQETHETSSGDDFSDRDTPLKRLEDFYIGPNVADSAARLRNSGMSGRHTRTWSMEQNDFASSDAPRSSADTRRVEEPRPSLTVPRASISANRTSQNTVWTDYSIDSRHEYPEYSIKLTNSRYQESEVSASDVESRAQRRFDLYPSSPETSPHGNYRSPDPTGDQLSASGHQLPELDTGDGFAVDYVTHKPSTQFTVPNLPDHSPPPVPGEATFPDLSSAPPSEYFDETRPSSYLHNGQDGYSSFSVSRPQSENFDLPGSTPRSVDQGSFENSEGPTSTRTRMDSQTTLADSLDQQENSSGISAKERKRLFTRLETLKELVDTEAFFIRDMSIVEEIYKGTAEACPKLDDKIIKLIFRNTDQIIAFHTGFLAELKEGVASVYVPKTSRSIVQKDTSSQTGSIAASIASSAHLDDGKDRETSLGPIFSRNMEKMKVVHETFLKNSDHAAKQLIQIQEDATVKVWLNECNEVARDLTKAWNLDSLLIKPMQRITKYPNLLIQLLHETPADHPDRPALEQAKVVLEDAIEEINKTKKNFELVGQIVGRKRKDSVGGFARAFGKRVDKLQATSNKPAEDADYVKLHEKFGDDYLRLQVVLRDVEFYTRQVSAYVHEFLQYLSSMELVMRLQPSPHPELESKWVRFNVSMRDIEKVALEQHLSQVRKQVIEPFEMVIKAYSNPSLAMKKRTKRRADYEKSMQLKKAGKKLDKQLAECVEQYEALNDALKKELPKLSALTEKVGNICLGNLVIIQTQWYSIWKEKVKVVLDSTQIPEVSDIVTSFQREFKYQEEQISAMSILNPGSKPRPSQSSAEDQPQHRLRPRPSELSGISSFSRGGLSVNSDVAPCLPTPDFAKRHSGQFTVSPSITSMPSPQQFNYRDYYAGAASSNTLAETQTMHSVDPASAVRPGLHRPGTGQSYESGSIPRQSTDSGIPSKRYSNSAFPSGQQSPPELTSNQRFSGIFSSAMPLPNEPERSVRQSRASSRASSRDRQPINGYNVMWLAASLFEFNIETTKVEAGYPYLTYQAGEIFDVIAEKGELWLAKNQDDPRNLVGWLWSKHFAKLADD
ncbi:hypothetical protein BJ166DRAFT_3974 [Pestalotiopsis sp. NC0098]|nr:hypothetical protein BJ166DRAFT_3974 [Pestalotiopsis sp. NC0098]